jgi:glucokinase
VILVGDIGGTRARFALLEGESATPVRTASLASKTYPNLEAAAREFLGADAQHVHTATLGVAGPVIGNRCTATNLPWIIDGVAMAIALGIETVTLLNDLVAHAYGTLTVADDALVVLQGSMRPVKRGANLAVIAAGTGLGEAALVWGNGRFVPLGTEGGHSDFAPRNELEIELLRFLRARFGRVSCERVLSGAGIGNLYDFFREARRVHEDEAIATAIVSAKDRNVAITEHALAGKSAAAESAIDLFLSLYGAEAGNLALKTLATGGVFIAGGIAASLLERLKSGAFVASFGDKGRFSALLREIPVALVVDANVGLAGAAYHALNLS